MGTTIKSRFQSFKEVPEGRFPPEYYTPKLVRAYVFGNFGYPLSLFFHSLFLVIFALTGVTILALFNIVSVILWTAAFLLHRKGYLWQAYSLGTIEIIAHAAICTAVIGWDTGFQYYVLVQLVVVFLFHWSTPRKAVIAAIYSCAYAAMNYYANISVPYTELSQFYTAVFNYGNIFSVCSVFAYIAYLYYRATINAEEKLEKENKKTISALRERNQAFTRLNQELAEAADYVRTILPLPITEGMIRTDWRFVPSTSLGGDAFGYHWVDEDHFAIYLIDVCGHGVGAALLSVSVMNLLRSMSLPDTDFKEPEQVLEALNITFPGEENNDMFFTIWYGVYSKNARQLTYASGGHPPAILIGDASKNDSKITMLRTPNNVIGGLPEITYQSQKHIIRENNFLYIFSDGVYEVEKSDGSMWRFKEFLDFMHQFKAESNSRLDHLHSYVKNMGNSEILQDDFTIVEVAFGQY